jgi:hypothetical protein
MVPILNSCLFQKDISLSSEVNLRLHGEITNETLKDFKEALESIEKNHQKIILNAVQLNSRGGSSSAAIEIGKIIREKKLNTYLAKDARCESACVSVLISGVERYAFGRVGVHRTTYNKDIADDSRVTSDIAESLQKNSEYIKSMGISMMLDDAINTTESWRMRYLTETEMRQWQVIGFDRLAEELYFSQTARERHISRQEFIDIFKSNYDDCLNEAREFKETIFECVKTKKLKESNYYDQFMLWLEKKLDSYDESKAEPLSFNQAVESLRKKIRDGKVYLRYSKISEVYDSSARTSDLKPLDIEFIQRMEEANKWWVEDNKIYVLLVNPIKSDLKEIVFELSDTDCKTEGAKKRLLVMPLLANLESKNSAIYSGQLPFNYDKVIGKGTRCGLIRSAFK